MTPNHDLRERAAECLRHAQTASDQESRALYVLIAQAWRALAEKAEVGPERTKNEPKKKPRPWGTRPKVRVKTPSGVVIRMQQR